MSNKAGKFLRAEVTHLGWAGHFGAVVGAGDASADKPDPAPILLALDRLGRTADRSVWYLGDTALDMAAARAAGSPPGWSAMHRTMVGLTGRVPISISLPRTTLPHVFVCLRRGVPD